MDTKIFRDRQNERDSLLLQASARYFYDKSEKLDSCSFISIIFLVIVQLICQSELIEMFLIFYFFIDIYLKYKTDYFINKGADFKLVFDEYVFFEKKIPNNVLQEVKELCSKNNKIYTVMINHNGTDKIRGVCDWYSSFIENTNSENPILLAQDENVYFDKNFRLRLTLPVIMSLTIFIVSIYIIKNESTISVLKSLFITFAVPVSKLIEHYFSYYKMMVNNRLLHEMISGMESNFDIQRVIDSNRRIKLLPFGNIYSVCRKKLHSNFNKYKNLF